MARLLIVTLLLFSACAHKQQCWSSLTKKWEPYPTTVCSYWDAAAALAREEPKNRTVSAAAGAKIPTTRIEVSPAYQPLPQPVLNAPQPVYIVPSYGGYYRGY